MTTTDESRDLGTTEYPPVCGLAFSMEQKPEQLKPMTPQQREAEAAFAKNIYDEYEAEAAFAKEIYDEYSNPSSEKTREILEGIKRHFDQKRKRSVATA
jgi:hypothetical protein